MVNSLYRYLQPASMGVVLLSPIHLCAGAGKVLPERHRDSTNETLILIWQHFCFPERSRSSPFIAPRIVDKFPAHFVRIFLYI